MLVPSLRNILLPLYCVQLLTCTCSQALVCARSSSHAFSARASIVIFYTAVLETPGSVSSQHGQTNSVHTCMRHPPSVSHGRIVEGSAQRFRGFAVSRCQVPAVLQIAALFVRSIRRAHSARSSPQHSVDHTPHSPLVTQRSAERMQPASGQRATSSQSALLGSLSFKEVAVGNKRVLTFKGNMLRCLPLAPRVCGILSSFLRVVANPGRATVVRSIAIADQAVDAAFR